MRIKRCCFRRKVPVAETPPVLASTTDSQCQAARDLALASVDAVALWREIQRLPRQELRGKIQAIAAYELQMGIESSRGVIRNERVLRVLFPEVH
eukprot:8730164-Pyramimonas_sp.AAC.1